MSDDKINYQVIRSKRRSIAIVIKGMDVVVRAPWQMSAQTIEDFVRSKQAWIESHRHALIELSLDPQAETLLSFGQMKSFHLSRGTSFQWAETADAVDVQAPDRWSDLRIQKEMLGHQRQQLSAILISECEAACRTLGVEYKTLSIRRYRRAWGKCNSKRELFFSENLIYTARPFIRYVAIHECCHLIHFNHSRAFYALVSRLMPDYKDVIRANTSSLQLPDRDL